MKKYFVFDLLAVSCLSAMGQGAAPERRPNILFIMADDHAAQAVSCYGIEPLCGVAPTPNIDRLAREGARLRNCFATNSISTPGRAAILTGQYSQRNGVYTLGDRLDPALPTVAGELAGAGYQTAVVGKWHLGSEPAYFDYYNVLPGQGRYLNPLLIEKGKYSGASFEDAVGEVYQGHSTDVITDVALDWLSKAGGDAPFFLMCHFKAPHRSWNPAVRFQELFAESVMPEPDNLLDVYSGKGSNIKDLNMMLEDMTEADLKTSLPTNLPVAEFRRWAYQLYIKDYLRCIAGIDANVGRLLDFLDVNGLSDNTVVVYTSDQGFFLGEHGFFDKRLMYEESIRMPFLIRYPGQILPSVCQDIVLNVDIAPALLDLAGLDVPPYMQGRSFVPNLLGNTPDDWQSSFYYRYWMHGDGSHNVPAHYGIRNDRYKLIFYYGQPLGMKGAGHTATTPVWEFYDLKEDPSEMNNLYGTDDSQYHALINRMKADLLVLKTRYGDEDSRYPQMKAITDQYYWADPPPEKFLYTANHLVLTATSITDSLRTIALEDMPNTYPANQTRLVNNPTPITERAWRLALRDAESNIVTASNGKKYFGAGKTFGMTVYTRDISYSGVLGLNVLYPQVMKSSLEYSREVRLGLGLLVPTGQTVPEIPGNWVEDPTPGTFLNKYKTHPYTRRTDDVVWVWAAYDLFEKNPDLADWQWLYNTISESFRILYNPFYDPSDGLFHGQASFIDIHNVDSKTTGYPHDYSVNDCILVKATSTNSLYYMAHKCMAEVCKKLGKDAEAADWLLKAQALRAAMLDNLRFADGSFTYYKDKNGSLQPRREALGTALAIITGVVTGQDALQCLNGYPLSWAGIQLLYPFFDDIAGVYHNNTAWPFVDTFFLWAKEIAEGKDYASQSAALLMRCTAGGSFREIVNWNTKEPARSHNQLWSAAGFINVCLRAGLVGEIIPPPADDSEPEDVWFDIDFSDSNWLDAFALALQQAGKDPSDIRTLSPPVGIDVGTVAVNGITVNGNLFKEETPFASVCGRTYQYAVRLRNERPTFIELPPVANAGRIVIYVRNQNAANASTLDLSARMNSLHEPDLAGEWTTDSPLMRWEVPGNSHYADNAFDLKLVYNIDSDSPLALRLYRNEGKFMQIYRIVLGKYTPNGSNSLTTKYSDDLDFSISGHTLCLSQTVRNARIQLYDVSGRQLINMPVNSSKIQLGNVQPGVYVLKLVAGQIEKTRKVLFTMSN